jgi:CRP/FNR family transcriptional regulator
LKLLLKKGKRLSTMSTADMVTRCDDCPMRTRGILQGMPQHIFEALTCCMATYRFPAHHVIFHEGNPCHQIGSIRSGRVKLSKYGESGRTQIIATVGAGFLLGYESFLDRPYQSSAETLTEVELCMASRQDILRQVRDHPDVAMGLLNFLCHRIEVLERKTLQLGTLSTRQRLAAYLLSIHSGDGTPDDRSSDQPPLTRREIAETLGMAKETLIRQLTKFEREHMIRLDGLTVIVKNPARLRQVLSATR